MIFSKNDDKIGILGENILINGRQATAFYIIDSINYSTLSNSGVNNHINRLESLFTSLALKRPEFSFSLFNSNKILTAKDIEKNLIDTIHLWDPSYGEIPEIFKNHIVQNEENFTILACNINIDEMLDVENVTIKEIANDYFNTFVKSLTTSKIINVNTKRILNLEHELFDIINRYGARASRELTFYTYISSIYPSYQITYNKNSYISQNKSEILGYVNQEIESKFGYFIMHNTGVEIFDLPIETTYGCILNIKKLPKAIDSDNFNLNLPNLKIFVKTLPKDKAKLQLKRTRADMEFEEDCAKVAGARIDDVLEENLSLAELALNRLEKGEVLCETKISILLIEKDLKKLKTLKQKIITTLADIKIFASISFNQGEDFINEYVKNTVAKYDHLCELRYPLSFQINNGTKLGDIDSGYSSPTIGEAYTI